MIIGVFEYNAKTDIYFGDVTFFDRKIHLKPVEKSNGKGPDYRVGTSASFGEFEFGAGWKRTSDQGKDYVSVAMDLPTFHAPVNAALFIDEGGGLATLVWRRQKSDTQSEQASVRSNTAKRKAKAA